MAQTIEQIFEELKAAKNADATLAGLDSTSLTAIWRLWLYIQAAATWTLQNLFDLLGVEINLLIANLKPHSSLWYANKCKAFQYGFDLLADTDQFDNTGYTAQQIEDSKIIKYAACVEGVSPVYGSFLRIKVAKLVAGDLAPLSGGELAAFVAYMERVKDAGVFIIIDSLVADKLKMTWQVYYNPLVLSDTGARLDGSDAEPVKTVIKEYLKNLPFNGEYRPTFHIDYVQKVDGVEDPRIINCEATYALLPFNSVAASYIPDAGYLRFLNDVDLVINYLPY
jgi:hypothetical protein